MSQQVTITPIVLKLANAQIQVEAFKRSLLSIITAISFIEAYETDANAARTVNNLRKSVDAYNMCVREPDPKRKPRNKGSSDTIFKLRRDYLAKKPQLIAYLNQIEAPLTATLYQEVAQLLGEYVALETDANAKLADYMARINRFSYCQHLLFETFPFFDPFDCTFIVTTGNERTSIDDFLTDNNPLHDVAITFWQASPKPINEFLLPPSPPEPPLQLEESPPEPATTGTVEANVVAAQPVKTEPETPEPAETEPLAPEPASDETSEFYIGHYLNTDFRPLLACVTLTWREGLLQGVCLQQKEDLYGKDGIGFVEAENGIQNPVDHNPYFVLLRNDPLLTPKHVTTAQYQQLTIEKELANGIRWGSYSTVVYRVIDRKPQYVPVTGLIVFQLVEEMPDLFKLADELADFADLTKKKAVPKASHALLQTIFSIRYQLQNRVISVTRPLSESMINAWEGLQSLVGRYTRYYIRLVYNRFETSHIEIFPDGTATMTQRSNNGLKHSETESVRGVVQIDDDRIWLHFGYNALTGYEKIRFILDRVKSPLNTTWLQGVYCSETLKKQQIASGRTMLVKLPDHCVVWPSFVEKDPDDLTLTDFKPIDSEQPERVLRFFTEETTLGKLADGPIWAGVARRLTEHSAIHLLDALCQKTEPYDNNQFYYYAFKKETPNENQFVIERDLVTFYANGKVTIQANRDNYSGYAYHYRKTLRLSLYNASDGFLEVFFDLDHNTTGLGNINVLYGVSVWHSPKRIQGKMVVLSRYGYKLGEFQAAIEQYRFTPYAEKAHLEAEDKRTGGILSYLRGNLHRYLHTTTQSSAQAVRPRDQTYREVNFLMACYYGTLIKNKGTDHASRKQIQLLKKCRGHLHESYIHGFGCNFAGLVLPIDFSRDIEQEAISLTVAEACYASHFLDPDLEPALRVQQLGEEPAVTIITRIREIAGEQRYFVWAFSPGGPLDRYDLCQYARPFWPELMKEVDKQTQVKPFGDGQPDYAA